jgi:hypothetical protein
VSGQGTLRFVLLGEELRSLLEALQQLKMELSAWGTALPKEPPGS